MSVAGGVLVGLGVADLVVGIVWTYVVMFRHLLAGTGVSLKEHLIWRVAWMVSAIALISAGSALQTRSWEDILCVAGLAVPTILMFGVFGYIIARQYNSAIGRWNRQK